MVERFYGVPETVLKTYTKQCSVMVTSKDIALMAATLANGGVSPKTKKRIIKEKNVDYILDHMELNGLYNQTEELMKTDGVYAKSGVSGILMLVIPGVMGVGIVSPPLNKYGNSVKGILTMKMLMKYIS